MKSLQVFPEVRSLQICKTCKTAKYKAPQSNTKDILDSPNTTAYLRTP
jgi:hypothetical protein